jgi:hypothetical protein
MSKDIVLEALIASPPTIKCQETIKVLEDIIRHHPEELRLLVFKRGIDFIPEDASMAMKTLIQKSCTVPAVVVNGTFFSSRSVPDVEELEKIVQNFLA